MNTFRITAAVALLAASATASATSFAQPPKAPHQSGQGPRGADSMTEQQQDKAFAIMHAQAPAERQLDKREHQAHEALRAHAESGNSDEATATRLAAVAGGATAAVLLHHARTQAQLDALMTPEQRRLEREDRHAYPHKPR